MVDNNEVQEVFEFILDNGWRLINRNSISLKKLRQTTCKFFPNINLKKISIDKTLIDIHLKYIFILRNISYTKFIVPK